MAGIAANERQTLKTAVNSEDRTLMVMDSGLLILEGDLLSLDAEQSAG